MIQAERRDIFRKMETRRQPVRVQIELTRHCNLDCAHCMIVHSDLPELDKKNDLNLNEVQSLFSQLHDAGTFHVNLTGGEPLTRPDALEIIESAFHQRFIVTLQTNGTLLKQDHVDLLARNIKQVRQIGISLYVMDAGVHESVTRQPGSHEKTLKAIHQVKKAGLPIVVVMALTRLNAHEFDAVQEFCTKNDLMFQYNTLIAPRDDGKLPADALRLKDEQLCHLPQPWETFMDEDVDPQELRAESPLSAWCSMGSTACYIASNGDVRPCSVVNTPAGNIRDNSFGEIWDNSDLFRKLRSLKLKDFECFSCEHFPLCNPCPGLAFLEHGQFTRPAKEICRINSVFYEKRRKQHD